MAKLRLLAVLMMTGAAVSAQTPAQPNIQAIGNATIYANPDQVQIEVGVVTQGSTAQDAAQQNATLANTLTTALKGVIGNLGSIQTTSYSVTPRYNNPPAGQTASIVGYTAFNNLQVTSFDITLAGRLIDTAGANGANSVGGLVFGLRDPEPMRQQALNQAAKQALQHAGAIAAGLGGKTGAVLAAIEGTTVTPIAVPGIGATAATTPIQNGPVTITATVTATVQFML